MDIEELTIEELLAIKMLIDREIFNINEDTAWDNINEPQELIDGASEELDFYAKLEYKINNMLEKK